jgi:hypothetical protein
MSIFWQWYDAQARPKLGKRADTFAAMFEYLDRFGRPVHIVETGCMRKVDNWAGDGCSSLLFDRYIQQDIESSFRSVDVDCAATDLCRSMTTAAKISTEDSVSYLHGLARHSELWVDLLYLDSFDLDPVRPLRSEVHHINELLAALPLIRPDTLVVVDDSPVTKNSIGHPVVSGKGALVARYAAEVGATMLFGGYQTGWTGMAVR